MAFRYDPMIGFTEFTSVENPKVEIKTPLMSEPIDLSSSKFERINDYNIPIVGNEVTEDIMRINFNSNHVDNPTTVSDMSLYSEPGDSNRNSLKISKEDSKNIVNALMKRLDLTKELASGIAGVMMAESGLNPKNYNKAEKSGTLKGSSANGSGYGTGVLLWSNDRKNAALRLIGKEGSRIEDLSLEDLLEMVARELEGPYKNTLLGIRASKTPKEAAATMYCHNVAAYSPSRGIATQSEIDSINKKYAKFGNKKIVNTGMNYAESIFNLK